MNQNTAVDYSKATEIAKSYLEKLIRGHKADYDECLSEALYGLAQGLHKFDASRGASFETFVCLIVRSKVFRFLKSTSQVRLRERVHFSAVQSEQDSLIGPEDGYIPVLGDVENSLISQARELIGQGYKPSQVRKRLSKSLYDQGLRKSQVRELFDSVASAI